MDARTRKRPGSQDPVARSSPSSQVRRSGHPSRTQPRISERLQRTLPPTLRGRGSRPEASRRRTVRTERPSCRATSSAVRRRRSLSTDKGRSRSSFLAPRRDTSSGAQEAPPSDSRAGSPWLLHRSVEPSWGTARGRARPRLHIVLLAGARRPTMPWERVRASTRGASLPTGATK